MAVGATRVGLESHVLSVLDPATGVRLGAVTTAAPESVDAIVVNVGRVQPLWASLRIEDRAGYMRGLAQAIIDEFDELVAIIGAEQGRPRAEVATLELLTAIDALIWIADDGARILGGRRVRIHRSMSLTKRARIGYEPFGVIGVIGAGSAPFAQPVAQIAAALLAGNGVVYKPARRGLLCAERISRLLARGGVPEGLVAIVHGDASVGIAVAGSPVGKVLFTGSSHVGRAVAATCVSHDIEVTVERGGKDAMIVLGDAHVGRAVQAAAWAGFAGAGQLRGSVERIYVAAELFESFVERLVAHSRTLVVGDPGDPHTQVGPLGSTRRREHVRALVEEAVAQGATLHCGGSLGTAPPGCVGAFFRPAVVTAVTPEMRLMREPLDGPVVTVTAVSSVEEAIAAVNDCEYRLGASVWTADRYQAVRIARELQVGMVWLNDHLPAPSISRGPWGASGRAGLGRTLGEAGLRACAQEKLVTWDPSGTRGLWWGPYDTTLLSSARTVAALRSSRDSDRERAWRHGALTVARLGVRALRR